MKNIDLSIIVASRNILNEIILNSRRRDLDLSDIVLISEINNLYKYSLSSIEYNDLSDSIYTILNSFISSSNKITIVKS